MCKCKRQRITHKLNKALIGMNYFFFLFFFFFGGRVGRGGGGFYRCVNVNASESLTN